MSEWQTMDSAPRDGDFWAANSEFMGVGSFYRHVEPATLFDMDAFTAFREEVMRPAGEIPWSRHGTLGDGFDYMEWNRQREALWESRKHKRTDFNKPNPKAGEVREWFYALACFSFTGAETGDREGQVGFTPTHWMPLPEPPAT